MSLADMIPALDMPNIYRLSPQLRCYPHLHCLVPRVGGHAKIVEQDFTTLSQRQCPDR